MSGEKPVSNKAGKLAIVLHALLVSRSLLVSRGALAAFSAGVHLDARMSCETCCARSLKLPSLSMRFRTASILGPSLLACRAHAA